MHDDFDEKRKHRRQLVNLQATYRSESLIIEAFVLNLSQGGLFISCMQVDSIGTTAEVSIEFPGEADPLVLHGSVAWSDPTNPQLGMGLRFRQLGKEPRLAIANFLLQSHQIAGA